MEWVGDRTDTLVLVTADHETGGLQLSKNAGKFEDEYVVGDNTLYYAFRGTNHTGTNVALYVYGVTADFTKSDLYFKSGSQKALKNIGIYYLMEEALLAGQE
jgi:alkaline phosphatase